MEGTPSVVGCEVTHGLEPDSCSIGVVTGGRERVSQGLANGRLTKSQRVDNGEEAKDGDETAGSARNVKIETLEAGLRVSGVSIGKWRGVQLPRDAGMAAQPGRRKATLSSVVTRATTWLATTVSGMDTGVACPRLSPKLARKMGSPATLVAITGRVKTTTWSSQTTSHWTVKEGSMRMARFIWAGVPAARKASVLAARTAVYE